MEKNGVWAAANAEELYGVKRWGNQYFSVSEQGTLLVHPRRNQAEQIDLKELIDRVQLRGNDLPVLVRFNDILHDRLKQVQQAFQNAIDDHQYAASYRCIYPIKVNQQRHIVEQLTDNCTGKGFGIEAGSKPELLAVIAMIQDDTPIICNGFKDEEFIRTALLAQKIGRNVIPIVEKLTELDLILRQADELQVRPQIGVRVKLASRGSGRWKSSGGFGSKFGLTVTEIIRVSDELNARNMQDCFKLLHFHLGSQITNIRHVKSALTEATRVYVDLKKRGAKIDYLDVGGGLGVDYDGSQTNFESSANYSLQEYANDVIFHVQNVCHDEEIEVPEIMSESGRALAAFHSVLVFEVLGVSSPVADGAPDALPENAELPVRVLFETYQNLDKQDLLESFHDAQQAFDTAISIFSTGHLDLEQRSIAERLYWAICNKVQTASQNLEEIPEELLKLDTLLAETYFCNFSLFQSLPDSWAIKQLFPVMPIHRLDSEPDRNGIIGDITCDSDGKMDRFIDRRDVAKTLPLHSKSHEEPYYLAVFLVGAYQEILGDLHNLFGDTNAVHVSLADNGEVTLDAVIKGDTVTEVLHYVQYNAEELLVKIQQSIESAVQNGLIDNRQAGRFLQYYEAGLSGYTYLE